MCKTKKEKTSRKRNIRKWPFFVFIPTGLVSIFLLIDITIPFIDEKNEGNKERIGLIKDFSPWIDSGFCAIYDHQSSSIHYPNGQQSPKVIKTDKKNVNNSLVAVSKDEVLFAYTDNSRTKTNIVAMDWDFKNSRTLLSINGDFTSFSKELIDGRICLGSSEKYITFNPVSGVATLSNTECDQNQCIEAGTFLYKKGDYIANIPYYGTINLSAESIDLEVTNLLLNWQFFPARCRKMIDDTICCSFHRASQYFGGQDAIFAVKANYYGEIIGYQFSPVKSSDQNKNLAYDIVESFADKIVVYEND